jgi:serine protease inhibitor
MKTLRLIVFFALAACSAPEPAPSVTPAPTPTPTPPSAPTETAQVPPVDPKFSAAQNAFGVALFKQIAQTEKNKNLFVSPSSAAVALAMAYNGARGETQKAMEQTLKLSGMTPDDVNKAANVWLKALETPASKVEISIGNSIWVRDGVPLQPQFTERIAQNYDARITGLDFSKPDAANTINAWVRGETKDKIEDIVASPISPDKVLFLINALYFKGQWATQFDAKLTHDAPFTLLSGMTVNVPTMSRKGDYEAKNAEGYQAVRLPYGDGRFSMHVFVPAEGKTVYDVVAQLTPETWTSMATGYAKRDVPLLMPKFTFKYEIVLNDTLKAMGMGAAFDPARSDLSGMVDAAWLGKNRLYISEVKQKTFVEVNEEGTEAAAATSVGITLTSAPVPFAVNRPFLTVIHDSATNTILFLGMVLDPRQS